MTDVIFYMIDREKHPEVYRAPINWYTKRSGKKSNPQQIATGSYQNYPYLSRRLFRNAW